MKFNSKILIVDNLSWLVNMKDTATTAGKLMKRLCELKKEYGASIRQLVRLTGLGFSIVRDA